MMINRFMKRMSEKACLEDLDRIDLSKLNNDVKVVKNISYINDNSPEHKLDIYYQSSDKLKPILIDIHGGGFISGAKEMDSLFANYFAQRGLVVVTVSYRLAYPKITVFDQIEDISNAVKWVIANAEKYKGNIHEMYIAGHSAGGVLAVAEALMCSDKNMRNDFNVGERNYKYNGIILDCGVMHFYKKSIAYWGMRNMIFPKGYGKMNKYQYLIFDKNHNLSMLPRTVLITNEKDELRQMTYHFKKVLDDNDVDNTLLDIGTDGHMSIVFRPYADENQKIMDNVHDFFGI